MVNELSEEKVGIEKSRIYNLKNGRLLLITIFDSVTVGERAVVAMEIEAARAAVEPIEA